jgi:hypothetical protein
MPTPREEPDRGGLGGGVGDRGPADARAHPGAAGGDVDLNLLEGVGAHEEGLLEPLDRACVVARRLRGDPQAALRGVADGLGHVVGVRHADECGGALVVGEVECLARGVPGLVALGQDLAMDAGLEFRESGCMRNEHATSIGLRAPSRIVGTPTAIPDLCGWTPTP